MSIRVARIVFMVVMMLMISKGADAQEVVGTVQIRNNHPFPVEVYSQTYNKFGTLVWVQLYVVGPNSFANIPEIPANSLLGVQSSQKGKNWPPFQVYYSNPYSPFYIYEVP